MADMTRVKRASRTAARPSLAVRFCNTNKNKLSTQTNTVIFIIINIIHLHASGAHNNSPRSMMCFLLLTGTLSEKTHLFTNWIVTGENTSIS